MTWLADLLALAGVALMTLGLIGIVRMPGRLPRIQVSGIVPIGAALIVVAAVVAGPPDVTARAVLVVIALLVTAPLSSHELAKLAASRKGDDEPAERL